jgi:hypothetical protein
MPVAGGFLLAAAAALFTAGCGYIGEPLPPLANVPARVTDLAAVQRGSHLIVQFTIPDLTTEAKAIKDPVKLDLRIGTAGAPFDADKWAAQAKSIPQGTAKTGLAHYEIPAAEWTNQEAILAVRAIGANGKEAGWSSFLVLPVVPPPERPAGVNATATAEGVHLTWRASGATFRVFRKTIGEFALVATVQQPQWTDTATEAGTPYIYVVQTIVPFGNEPVKNPAGNTPAGNNPVDKTGNAIDKPGNNKEAQSDLSEEFPITPVDTFAPAVPSGLSPSAATNSIELVWERNTETDLAGYRIYRAVAGGAFEKLADVSQIPSYSDRNVEHGKTYRYAVSALDHAGNESARTPAAEVMVP